MPNEIHFQKYAQRGAYHWKQIQPALRTYNAFVAARYQFVMEKAAIQPGNRVLDLGCGDGTLTFTIHQHGGESWGVDVTPEALTYAKSEFVSRNISPRFVCASAYQVPFPDSSFDVVISSDVIEHVQQPELLLQEAYRLLKPGGRAVISTPIRVTETPLDKMHVQEFFPTEYIDLVRRHFDSAELHQSHPLDLKILYERRFPAFRNKRLYKFLINWKSIRQGQNPFLSEHPTLNSLMTAVGHRAD